MRDWAALEQAAAALRRLNRAVAGRELPDEALREIATVADRMADRMEHRPRRDKEADLATFHDLAAAIAGRPLAVDIGEPVEFDPFSAGGGRLHPAAVETAVRRDGDAAVTSSVRVDHMFQGPPGRVHGGILAVLIDELMGTVNRMIGQRAFTARLAVDYRAAAPVDTDLTFRAWLHEQDGRKITMRAEGRAAGELFVEAEALFVVPRPVGADDVDPGAGVDERGDDAPARTVG